MTRPPFAMTGHAIARALDMRLEGDEVRRAVEQPQDVRDGRDGAELRTAGRITVVYRAGAVVTILWRYQSTRRADVRGAETYGREAEHAPHRKHRAAKRAWKPRREHDFEGSRANRTGRLRARRQADDDADW